MSQSINPESAGQETSNHEDDKEQSQLNEYMLQSDKSQQEEELSRQQDSFAGRDRKNVVNSKCELLDDYNGQLTRRKLRIKEIVEEIEEKENDQKSILSTKQYIPAETNQNKKKSSDKMTSHDIKNRIYQFQIPDKQDEQQLKQSTATQEPQDIQFKFSRIQRLVNRLTSSKIYQEVEEEKSMTERELLDQQEYKRPAQEELQEDESEKEDDKLREEDLALSAGNMNKTAIKQNELDEFQEPLRSPKIEAHLLIRDTNRVLRKLQKSCELINSSILKNSSYSTDNKFRNSLSDYRTGMMRHIASTEQTK